MKRMKRYGFLAPAAIAAVAAGALVATLDLSTTWSYALIGLVGLIVLSVGITGDIRGHSKRSKVVKMHEAAVGAEESYCPEAMKIKVARQWDQERLLANSPLIVPAGRAGTKVFGFQKLDKRAVFVIRHYSDPMLKQHA